MRRPGLFTVLVAAWLQVLLGTVAGCQNAPGAEQTRFRGSTMGTEWTVVLPGALPPARAEQLQLGIESLLSEQNALFSTWDPDSVLSRFNAFDSVDYVRLPFELLDLLEVAHGVSRASGGAYDVSFGEVFALYGVGPDDVSDSSPDAAELAAALERAGSIALVRLDDRLRKRDPRVRIDLSSIAKGHAVDRLGEYFEHEGFSAYLVEIGGEVRTRGRGVEGEGWRIGLESPDGGADDGLRLEDAHLATSGSYRNWRTIGGERVSHVIDARSGLPITHALVSVTVIAASTALADAWATALLVLGTDEAWSQARRHGLEVQLISRGGDRFVVARTRGLESMVIDGRRGPVGYPH